MKNDIMNEKEKAAKLRSEQIEGIRCKEKRVKKGGWLIGLTQGPSLAKRVESRAAPYHYYQRTSQSRIGHVLVRKSLSRDQRGYLQLNNNP